MEEKLTLQILKADADQGFTFDNHYLYNELGQFVDKNPGIGVKDDFSIFVVNTVADDVGNIQLVLLCINRLPIPIKDIAFDYTLGNQTGEYIWENKKITLPESGAGTLKVNSTVPIILPLTVEQETLLKSLNKDNREMTISNFTYESAE